MERRRGGGGGDDTSPVSNGQREQPTPVSPLPSDPLPSEGGDMTPATILGRINELARQILVELDGGMTTEVANLRAIQLDRAPAPTRTAGQDLDLGDGRFVPASSEAMARLRETTVAEETREEDEECAVCLKSFEEGDRMVPRRLHPKVARHQPPLPALPLRAAKPAKRELAED
ncbi:hypothetical protein HU200_054391 [Digitaria exilis]|uniref:Uncharacterized protein n=1 Tax=Digitaria exilis TaxID=1010633 RepID=A0A835AHK6_9POAL|nr:hypothetical protein HU200_054391 [Digitaria exilis]